MNSHFQPDDFLPVDLETLAHPRLKLHSMYYAMGFSASSKIYARQAVVRRVLQALDDLPQQYGLLIWDIYRPRAVQATLFEWMRGEVKAKYPTLTDEENYQQASKYASPPTRVGEKNCAPHLSGGAIDLTLFEVATGNECEMGTPFDDCTARAHRDYFANRSPLSNEEQAIKARRDLLEKAMVKTGFVAYEFEWWHFSLGDRIWARLTGQAEIFGPLFGDNEWPESGF